MANITAAQLDGNATAHALIAAGRRVIGQALASVAMNPSAHIPESITVLDVSGEPTTVALTDVERAYMAQRMMRQVSAFYGHLNIPQPQPEDS